MSGLYRIIVHWTAGNNARACATDREAYHFMILKDGTVVRGTHTPEDNINTRDGRYAHHTGDGNTGSIGVALCGMGGYQSRRYVGQFPLTRTQCDSAFKLIADLCKKYNIDPNNVMTHYEFGKSHRGRSSGKIDITYLPPYPNLQADEIGSFIRKQVRQRMGFSSAIKGVPTGAAASTVPDEPTPIPEPTPEPSSDEPSDSSSSSSSSAAKNTPLAFLSTTNDWLEKVPQTTIDSFNNIIGTGENIAQSKVDDICEWLSYKVNVAVERKRQALIKTLHEQYMNNQNGPLMKAAKAISSFFSDPLGALGSLASAIFEPIKPVFDWLKILTKEIPRLAANLANIVSVLPPPPPNPHINFDKFKLKVNSFGLKEIVKGTSGMKAPEQMFSAPPDPFHADNFTGLFGDSSAELISEAFKYKLKPEDFESINAMIQKEAGSSILGDINLESF